MPLPQLYVIGDSISIDYGPYLQANLKGIMDFSRKKSQEESLFHLDNPQGDSGGNSSMVLSFLKTKARHGGIDADFVLLNCGLHDIKTDPVSGKKQVPLNQYEKNLQEIIKTVGNNKTQLIWIRTTLFEDDIHNSYELGFHRYSIDCMEYNRIADCVMQENGIPIIDLCTFTLNLGKNIFFDHVHFIEPVREKQGTYIANWLKERINCTNKFVSQNIYNNKINENYLSVSVLLCCYNSSAKLPETLRHLIEQEVPEDICWEVIVVDNASTDNTAQVARSLWPNNAPAPLRIVSEPTPGLSHARKKGIEEAKYDLICFVDDDNWLAPDWIKFVSQIMSEHPEVGACGGRTEAVFEIEPPEWFVKYSASYVIGRQGDKIGDVTWSRGNLWGAGLTIRKKAWTQLIENGFQQMLTGRTGNKLSSGEDYEMCYALRLSGWRLWYSDDLVLKHFIPACRLTLAYLFKLMIGFGEQTIFFDPYNFYVRYNPSEIKSLFGKIWVRQFLLEVYTFLFRDGSFWKQWHEQFKNTYEYRTLWMFHWGRINALLKFRNIYEDQIKSFEQNRWIRIDRHSAKNLYKNQNVSNSYNLNLSTNPLVTVLICNYNYGQYLGEAIDSALSQTWKNLECIVVDDGSTDESRKVLKEYEGKIKTILKENGGQASAFNAGVTEAKGEIICFLDSDDLCHPERVCRVIEKYRQAPWGLVCHDLDLIDGKGNALNITWTSHAGVNLKEGKAVDAVIENNYSWIFSPTSGMSMQRKLAEKIFPLPSEKWKISADEPLAFLAACLDSLGSVSESLGAYRIHSKNLFATFHDDMEARRIAGITHTTRRYFFCKQITSELNRDLPAPKTNYRYYRLCCLIARDKPSRYIVPLLKKNIYYHLINRANIPVTFCNIVKYFAADLLIILGRIFKKSSKHNLLKARFDKEALKIDKEQLKYILYDE